MSAPHELSTTRHIDAPPETVWRVWTGRMREWFAPKPWAVPRLLRLPAFAEGVGGDDPLVRHDLMAAITTFAPEGTGTRYTATARHWSEDALKRHEAMGFREGWSQVAGQLAELAEAEAKADA